MLSQLSNTCDAGLVREESKGDKDKPTGQMTSISQAMQEVQLDEEEIRDLEEKKHTLERRVAGIEKDLAGVLR